MLTDDHWDVWHLSTCHRGVICTLLRSILWGKTRCPVLIRPAVMFLMTSSPLQATQEFQIFLLSLLWACCSLSQAGMWILTHLNPPKTIRERERALCVRVCACVCRRATTRQRVVESVVEEWEQLSLMSSMLFVYHALFIYGNVGTYCKIYLIHGI